jgi:hypothetical protein
MPDGNNNGPSEEILRFLRTNLRGMADGVARGRLTGRGVSVPVPTFRPTKICIICLGLFAPRRSAVEQPVKAVCRDCQGKLAEGLTACICDEPHKPHGWAFVNFKSNPEVAGKIVKVSIVQFARLQQKFKSESHEAPPDNPA